MHDHQRCMENILIINGTLVGADGSEKHDLAIRDGKIMAIGKLEDQFYADFRVVDASGKYVIPGGFDPHVHMALPTPAGPSSDDFRSGSQAALAGGTTFIMDFVTPKRGQSLPEALKLRQAEAAESRTGWGLHMGISEWNPKIAVEIIPCIANHGIRSFKAYLAYRESIGICYDELGELMQIVGPAGGLVMVHCEDGEMIERHQQELLRLGKTRPFYHVLSRPQEAEIKAISRVIELSARTGCQVYIVHTSTGRGADLISEAKKNGTHVFGETCPHYLLLDDFVYDAMAEDLRVLPYIISPPIRPKFEQQRLWKGLSDGTFDVVATDHCPFNFYGQKDQWLHDFTKIPSGAGSIEHRLSLLYTYGVKTGKITITQFVNLVSTRPAEIFGLGDRKGKLLPGYDADIVIWDPDYKGTISVANHVQKCDSEIYEGFPVTGRAETVILSGKII
jgi:dihydropyrimidinase